MVEISLFLSSKSILSSYFCQDQSLVTSCTGRCLCEWLILAWGDVLWIDLGSLWRLSSLDSSWTGQLKGSSVAPPLPSDVWLTYTTMTSPVKFITCPLEIKVVLLFPVTWPAENRENISVDVCGTGRSRDSNISMNTKKTFLSWRWILSVKLEPIHVWKANSLHVLVIRSMFLNHTRKRIYSLEHMMNRAWCLPAYIFSLWLNLL